MEYIILIGIFIIILIMIILFFISYFNKPNIYLTMTTVPERIINPWFYDNLKNTLNLNGDYKVLLNIPYKFKKTGEEYIIPDNIKELEKDNLIINRVYEDYGPLTKLFGALLNNNIPDNSALLICDDDIHYKIDFVNYLYKEG